MINDQEKEREADCLPVSPQVTAAATWLAGQHETKHPVAEIRIRFHLTMKEACSACTLAAEIRSIGRASA